MSDWQKVRVTFNDADGNGVSAVGWTWQKIEPNVFIEVLGGPSDGNARTGEVPWSICAVGDKVTPIRELPTGVGAVIRLKDGSVLTRNIAGMWCAEESDDDMYSNDVEKVQYEILSEGIQL